MINGNEEPVILSILLCMFKIFHRKRKNEGCVHLKSEYKELDSLKRFVITQQFLNNKLL